MFLNHVDHSLLAAIVACLIDVDHQNRWVRPDAERSFVRAVNLQRFLVHDVCPAVILELAHHGESFLVIKPRHPATSSALREVQPMSHHFPVP